MTTKLSFNTASTDTITVYGRTPCVQCDSLKRYINSKHLDETFRIEYKDVSELTETQLDEARERVGMQAPVVLTPEGFDDFSGFRPDVLGALAGSGVGVAVGH